MKTDIKVLIIFFMVIMAFDITKKFLTSQNLVSIMFQSKDH